MGDLCCWTLGNSLGQRAQDKLPLGDANVGHNEAPVLDLLVLVQQDVEVNVARALVDELLAAERALNVLELVEQRQRVQLRLDLTSSENRD